MISCRYSGTFLDYSGYGSANRSDIVSLFNAGVNVSTELVVQVPEKTSYGVSEYIARSLQDRTIPYKVKIIHLTPDMYPRYKEDGKYHIGRLMWETDKLPDEWVKCCNEVNEIWTASERMANTIKSSGVKVPVMWFPQAVNISEGNEIIRPFQMNYKKDFIFYSVFQWIERKNPRGLLEAYWKAFEGKDDVTLLLKTYRVNYSPDEFANIKRDIESWKLALGLKHYPKVFLVPRLLKHSEMMKLHALGDCYVNPSSGEGWCRPLHEAMLHGKPVISGDNGGLTDYLTDDHYFRVPSAPINAAVTSWIPWYMKNMNWWVLKTDELSRIMRHVYEDKAEAQKKAAKAKQYVEENTSYQTVGTLLKNRLVEIERIL